MIDLFLSLNCFLLLRLCTGIKPSRLVDSRLTCPDSGSVTLRVIGTREISEAAEHREIEISSSSRSHKPLIDPTADVLVLRAEIVSG